MDNCNACEKRRFSLFRQNTFDEEYEPSSYPPEYSEKLNSELGRLKSLATEVKNERDITTTGYKSKMKSTKILNEVKLSQEQTDFLSSLPDYDTYVDKVSEFCNKIKIAVEMANLSNKMYDEEVKKYFEINNKKIPKLLHNSKK